MTIASEFPHKASYLSDNQICAFSALEQLQGRGQRLNEWKSPQGNLYVTFLMKTKTMPYWASLITGYTICQTVAEFGMTIRQKWINDLFFEGKKVGGILCESENVPNSGYYLSIGVGINLKSCPEDCALLKDLDREDLFWALSKNLSANIRQADEHGPHGLFKKIEFEYLNQHVVILDHLLTNVLHEGVFSGVNGYGHAQVQTSDGTIKSVSEGRMRQSQK